MKQWFTKVFHLLKNFLLKLGLHLHVEVVFRSSDSKEDKTIEDSDDPELKE